MTDTDLRRRVAWLIAIRAIIGTILLGTATLARITAPELFPGDPFFLLIGLTYALTIAYAVTLRFVDDRHRWLVDVQLAGAPLLLPAFFYPPGGIPRPFTSVSCVPFAACGPATF